MVSSSFISMLFFFFFFFFLLCLFFYIYILSRKSGRRKLPLPPGSLGWPYIGETLQLYSQNPNVFFASKQKRYGPVFKTHILGCHCVMISSPEAAKFVLLTRAQLFKPTFPPSKERMIGEQALFFQQGEYHSRLRKLVLNAFMPETLKKYVSKVEILALHSLNSWDGHSINTYQEMKEYAFNVALLAIFGKDKIPYREELKHCYYIVEKGYNAMPINLPGTLFHRAMKARKQITHILSKIMASTRQESSDLLGSFMGGKESFTEEQIADNIIGVIFAARDTTASVLTWVVKYLTDHPKFLQAVTEEQEAIIKEKEKNFDGKMDMTWADTKKMPITSRVIQETMRVASVLSFTFREAVEDVEYEGYLIPKGWKVLPLFRNIHHSPDIFPNPEKFDPTRFEEAVMSKMKSVFAKSNTESRSNTLNQNQTVSPKPNTFFPFGIGIHSCPGNELAKLEMLVLLHHLTTKYRWCVLSKQEGIQYGPFALPHNGLPARFSLKK